MRGSPFGRNESHHFHRTIVILVQKDTHLKDKFISPMRTATEYLESGTTKVFRRRYQGEI